MIEELEGRTLPSTFAVTSTDDSGPGSLRQAIIDANARQGDDAITFDTTVFATPRTITLTTGQLELSDTTGATAITGPAAGVTVSAGGASRVFQVDAGVTASISGLTITAGSASNGGGLYNNGGNLTLTDCTVSGNSAGRKGGGLYTNNGGSATLTDCTVSGNTAGRRGGGLGNFSGILSLNDCTVSGNSAAGTYGFGGGLINYAQTTLTNCTVSGNSGANGAGLANIGGTVTLADSTFNGNSATWGGGLYNTEGGTVTLTGCTVSGNSAFHGPVRYPSQGGGVYTRYSGTTTTLINCTVSGNSTSGNGGGLFATDGGATTLANTIVAGNTASTGPDVSGGITSRGNNLIGATDGSSGWLGSDLTGTLASPLDPRLAPLADNGGPTRTMALLPGSPALNAGGNALVPGGVTTDGRGLPRIANDVVDIGAFESQAPLTLVSIAVSPANPGVARGLAQQFTATGTYDDGSTRDITGLVTWASATPSVATISDTGLASTLAVGTAAITASLAGVTSPDDVLNVTPAQLLSIAVSPSNPFLIVGTTQQFTATGVYTDGSRDITGSVTWASSGASVAAISGTGLAPGLSIGTSVITASLGGITSPPSILEVRSLVVDTTVDELDFSNSRTSLREAIAAANALPGAHTITFDATVFNAAQTIDLALGQLELSDTTGATTIRGAAAGVTVRADGTSRVFQIDNGVTTSISGLTITGGSADNGGGLYNYGGNLTLTDCTVTGNSASSGSGLWNSGNVTLTNSTFSGNSVLGNSGNANPGVPTMGTAGSDSGFAVSGSDLLQTSLSQGSVSGNIGDEEGLNSAANIAALTDGQFGSADLNGSNPDLVIIHSGVTITYALDTGSHRLGYDISRISTYAGWRDSGRSRQDYTVLYSTVSDPGTFHVLANVSGPQYGGRPSDTEVDLNSSTGILATNVAAIQFSFPTTQDGYVGYKELDVLGQPSSPSAQIFGGDFYNDSGDTTLTNCTVVGIGVSVAGGTTTLTNSIVAGDGTAISGTVSGSNNLIGTGGSGGLVDGVDGNIIGVADPGLSPLGDHGGPTQTIALLPGSPALDAGRNGGILDGSSTDQRGLSRIVNGTVDIGAFESSGFTLAATTGSGQSAAHAFPAPLVVTVTAKNPNEPVAGGWITFTPPASGATAIISGSPAMISASGTASATATSNRVAGSYTVSATASGAASTTSFNLRNSALVSIAVSPDEPGIAKGLAQQFSATGTYDDGSTEDITGLVTWASATPSVATIDGTGLASTLAVGTSTITASLAGVTSPDDVLNVTPAELASIAVSPSNPFLIVGTTQQFTATGVYTDGSRDITGSVRWASSGPSVAPIDGTGLASGLSPGRSQIGASLGGITSLPSVLQVGSLVVDTTVDELDFSNTTTSLREAITLANAIPGAHTITFDPIVFSTARTIKLARGQLELSNTTWMETITAPAAGVTVSAGGASRVFQVDAGVTASISGLTISGGNADNGGGLFVGQGATLVLTGCTISGNHAGQVGGGLLSYGTMTLTDCTISGNSAGLGGGGLQSSVGSAIFSGCTISYNSSRFGGGMNNNAPAIFTNCIFSNNNGERGGGLRGSGLNGVESNLTLTACTFSGNHANIGGGLYSEAGTTTTLIDCTVSGNSASNEGGGLYSRSGTTTLIGSTISGNSANYGGGLYSLHDTLTLTDCTVTGNTGGTGDTSNGAGVRIQEGTAALTNCDIRGNSGDAASGVLNVRGTVTLTDCTISDNSASAGSRSWSFAGNSGGVCTYGGTTTLTNCTISGNSASKRGGGVFTNNGGTTTLTNCTVSGNSADTGGGLANDATIILGNTIVAGNTASRSPDASGGVTSRGANLIGATDGSSGWLGSDLTGTLASPLDPRLAPLADNGGPTRTMALLTGSPALNAGANALVPDGVTTDGRGLPRIISGFVDIGAFESQTPVTLVSLAVSPTSPGAPVGLAQQFTATGTFSDGSKANLTSSVNWASSTASVATISGTGLAATLSLGTSVITASLGSFTSAGVTLTVQPPALISIALSPSNTIITRGHTQQFTATGIISDGSTVDLTSSVTWASATPSVATIDGTGLATGLSGGTSVITASLGGITSAPSTLKVFGFVVNTTVDELDFTNDTTSLREAITFANANPGDNTITFALPAGSTTIHILSPLPAITSSVVIDGFSQPGYAGTPLVELDGTQAGYGDGGLTITAAGVTVRGLDIHSFYQFGIHLSGAGATGDRIYGNFLGTDPTGKVAGQGFPGYQRYGVRIDGGASGNLIGTDGDGVNDTAERNLISGNLSAGVWINGQGTNGNVVAGNFIGTTVTGDVALPNGNDFNYPSGGVGGVVIQGGASGNRIGTDGQSVDAAGRGNVILGNKVSGVVLSGSSGTVVAGNLITANAGPGVVVGASSNDAVAGNRITANRIFANAGQAIDLGKDGVTSNGTSPRSGPNNLQNFPLVLDASDGQTKGRLSESMPNTTVRIDIFASAQSGPGGSGEAQAYLGSLEVTTDETGGVTFAIPFAAPAGLPILTATATDPQGNTSEVSALRQTAFDVAAGFVRFAAGQTSVPFSAAAGDRIVLRDDDAAALDPTWNLTLSVTSGTLRLASTAGLSGSGDGTGSLSYSGSLSALNAALSGMAFIPPVGLNGNTTFSLDARSVGAAPAHSQLAIGTGHYLVTTTADSGPGSLRQAILDSNTAVGAMNTIEFIIAGSGVHTIFPLSHLPEIVNSVRIDGFSQPGYAGMPLIELNGSHVIAQNGIQDSGNGLTIIGSGVTVRGLDIDSFGQGAGIRLYGGGATNAWIYANFLGTDPTGMIARPNIDGIQIYQGAGNNLIGTNVLEVEAPGQGNVLSGNSHSGIDFIESRGNVVAGNFIGTDATGSGSVPNQTGGIAMRYSSIGNTIGGATAGAGNLITNNGGPGVSVGFAYPNDCVDNRITGNRIFANAGPAIDIADDGVTYNSASLPEGSNQLQNFPIFVNTGDGRPQGMLSASLPNATYHLEFFASSSYGPGGSGEAERFLGTLEVTTDSQGQAIFDVPYTPPAGLPILTATATDPQGNTSEVSAARRATVQAPAQTVRAVANQPLVFATHPGNAITIQDQDAGPFDAVWNLTLSVSHGTLAFSSIAGLNGSGNGTGSLSYRGTLSAVDAALAGLTYTPPAGTHVFTILTLVAQSYGTASLQTQFAITNDGVVVVDTTADSGPGSLRQAILDANLVTGLQVTVDFAIKGAGVQTIAPITPLPPITAASVLIDGSSQPGYAGTPRIALVGQSSELTFSSRNFAVRGLTVDRIAIDTETGVRLSAVQDRNGFTTGLTLLDAQGQALVRSDGLSAAQSKSVVEVYVASGRYFLVSNAATSVADGSLSVTLTPASDPFQPVPVANDGHLIPLVTADFNGDGIVDIATPEGVYLGFGDGGFASPPIRLALPDGRVDYSDLVAADLKGDGKLDLILTDPVTNTVLVLLGNGDGTFQPASSFAAGSVPSCLVVGDFNGDGKLDLAVSDTGDLTFSGFPRDHDNPTGGTDPGGVSLLLGNGDGTFQPARSFAAGPRPQSLVAGDFNGDGKLDLIVINRATTDQLLSSTSTDVGCSLLLGNGDGTFQARQTIAVPSLPFSFTSTPGSAVVEDFNGDGKLDLAVLYSRNGAVGGASVSLGNGDGTFQPATDYKAGANWPGFLRAGDFNGDGKIDLTLLSSSVMFLITGNGDGTFQPAKAVALDLLSPGIPRCVAAGDFNGDGRLDVAVSDSGSNAFQVLLSNVNGAFRQSTAAARGVAVPSVSADFNGDGNLDLATFDQATGDVSLLLGTGGATFLPAKTFHAITMTTTGVPGTITMVAGDFNGDGRTDFVVTNVPQYSMFLFLGNGDGTFQPPRMIAERDSYYASTPALAGDFNRDGKLDLVASILDSQTQQLSLCILVGNGDGTFQPPRIVAGDIGGTMVADDFNGDGKLDLAIVHGSSDSQQSVFVILGNGDGTFQPPAFYPIGATYSSLMVAGDFNGDGKTDLLVHGIFNGLSILIGNGDGTFQPGKTSRAKWGSTSAVAYDFNADGKTDLAIDYNNMYGDGGLYVLLGKSDGTFESAWNYPLKNYTTLVGGSFAGKGGLDLAFFTSTDSASVMVTNGDGTFTSASQFALTPQANPVVADVNGDGTDDVLVLDGSGNILYRQGIPGQPGSFAPPVKVNPDHPSRDIAWLPQAEGGEVIASVDTEDNAISLFGYRNGGFVKVLSMATGSLPAQVIAADMDHDGWTDLVVRNVGDGTLSIFFRTSFIDPLAPDLKVTPQFSTPLAIAVGLGVSEVQAVDTTGDGKLDLVVTNKLTGQLGVLQNRGNNAFAPLAPYRAGTGLSAIGINREVSSQEATAGVAAGPFTPGGPTNLVTINPGTYTLSLLGGLGGGRFANPVAIQTRSPARVVRMADFTGNGINSLAILTADGVSISLGDGRGGFSEPVTYDAGLDPTGLTISDIDGNGIPDLLIGNAYGDVLLLIGNGDGTFRPYRKSDQGVALAVSDLTGDGKPDFIYANQGLDRVVVQYGGDQAAAVLGDRSSGLLAPGAVKLADLTGDGIKDLIVANSGSNNILVYPGLGNGQFGPATNGGHGYFVGTNPTGIEVANLNGQPDLIVANAGSNDVSILLGQGSGSSWTLTPGPRIKTDAGPVAVAVGNLTSKGTLDLAVANQQANNVQVFPGIGGGFFGQTPTTYAVGQAPSGLFLGNFDGSGPGIAALNAGSNSISLIDRGGVTQTINAGGLRPSSGFAGDFNGTGFTDLVVGNSGDGRFSLFTGGPTGLSLSLITSSAAVPSPTALSFAGFSDGVLSFYAASAGHEAASLLAFSFDGLGISPGSVSGGGLGGGTGQPPGPDSLLASSIDGLGTSPGGVSGGELEGGTGQSSGSVLAAATTGAFQQAAQLLGLNGSAHDLIATLLTVSLVSGNFETGVESQGEIALLANFLPSTGVSAGQSPDSSNAESDSGGTDAQKEKEESENQGDEEGELPIWEQLAVGLQQAWEQLRVDMLKHEGIAPEAADRAVSKPDRNPPAPLTRKPAPSRGHQIQPRASRTQTGLPPLQEAPRPAGGRAAWTDPDVIDAAIAELAEEQFPEDRPSDPPTAGPDGEAAMSHDPLIQPLAAAIILVSTETLARWIRSTRAEQERRARRILRPPVSVC